MSLSAADLQKKHALEGAPDPFPSLPGGKDPKPTVANGKHSKKPQQAPIDTSSEALFPSLGGPASGKKPQTPSAWSTGGARERVARPERVSRPAVQSYIVSDTIELDKIDLKAAGKGGKPTTLGEVMRNVMAESGATIEASTARMTGKTTFIIKGHDDYVVETAKKLLISGLAPVVSKKLDAPASTIGMIIGPKGATLKGIREATNVRVDIPPRNASLAPPADGSAQVSRSPSPHAANDGADDEEATIPITISGPAPLVDSAISMIQDIIDVKTSKITQRVKEIPAHVFPFLLPKIEELTTKAYQENPYKILNVDPRQQSNEIVCSGDRVVVAPTVEALKEAKQELEENLQSITLSMSRAQFPYILEPIFANELLTEFGAVAVPLEDDQAGLMIYGREGLGNALSRILAKSQERHSHSWPVRGHDLDKSLAILEYLVRSGIVKDIEAQDASLAIHIPTVPESRKRGQVNLELIGDRAPVKTAVGQLEKRAAAISDGLKGIEVEPIVLKVLKNKHGKALEKLQTDKNVIVSYPSEDSHSSTLIILHNHNGRDTDSVSKVRRCNEAAASVQTLIKTVSDIKSETVTVDRKWHSAITGKQGATLESIIGEDKILSIEFGSRGKELKENEILVRGPADEVQRAVKQIHQVVADAEQYEIDHSYVLEFTIPQEHVGRVVGSQGSTIKQIRESLDVKIDFNDESHEGADWNEKGRGKKAVSKSKVRIQGTKEGAEEAKKRILAQVEKLADETEEKLNIARIYHPGLIGAGGKYVSRMEDTHGVKIFFPRDGGSGGARELRENEVLVKGGRKGVAAAKAELLELVEFEKATNLVVKFDVPTKAISRILGKGGVSINEIKTNTGASIDVEKEESSPGKSSITVRGSSDQTKDAKAAILAIASEVGDEVTEILYIEPQYHRNFIGKGGETLRQLIISAGGPEDPKLQAGLVHFPRAGEPSDEVRLRGDKKVVAKLKKELEKRADAQRDRIILGVGVPASLHRALIGRGGQHLNELQARTGTQVWFPGSRSYGGAGEPVNADQLGDVAFEDLVKVMGPKSGCEAAIAELQAKAAESSQQRERPSRISAGEQVTRSVYVPVKYHHVIVHQGGFQRSLRPHNVFVDFSQIPQEYVPPRPTSTAAAASARIDQDEAPVDDGVDWQVAPNYEGAEEGEAEWTLRGRDEASLDTAEDLLKEAIKHAESLSHVGFLTLTDRSAFPRIVGAKGSNVSRIRAETGTEITVGKGDNTIVIIGSEAGLQDAKDAIMQTVEGGGRGRGRQD